MIDDSSGFFENGTVIVSLIVRLPDSKPTGWWRRQVERLFRAEQDLNVMLQQPVGRLKLRLVGQRCVPRITADVFEVRQALIECLQVRMAIGLKNLGRQSQILLPVDVKEFVHFWCQPGQLITKMIGFLQRILLGKNLLAGCCGGLDCRYWVWLGNRISGVLDYHHRELLGVGGIMTGPPGVAAR